MTTTEKTCSTCAHFARPKPRPDSVACTLGMGVCLCEEPAENPRPITGLMHPDDTCEHHKEKLS